MKLAVGVSLGSDTPYVVTRGAGQHAEWLMEEAARQGIPALHDEAAATALYRVPLGEKAGRDLFPVMAVLLGHVLRMDRNGRGEEDV